eukprot:gene23391-31732_t
MLAIPLTFCEKSSLPQASIAQLTSLLEFQCKPLSKEQEGIINDEVAQLCRIRTEAVFPQTSDYSVEQTSKLLKYCLTLRSVMIRLRDYEGDLATGFKDNFHWKDAFVLSRHCQAATFYLDIACCYWNLGAIESLRGARVDRTTEEGIRAANKHFQQAAGFFEHIREHILPNLRSKISVGAMMPCLSEDCLNMARQLMLAQAQLCFYEKAVKDKRAGNMKPGIIAKIAMQTSKFYASTCAYCGSASCGAILDVSWFAITDFQQKCFRGASEYWQAVASKEAEIARLRRAELWVQQSIDVSKKFSLSSSLPAGADGLLSKVRVDLQAAVHDMNTVYLESIPADMTLEEVPPVVMVKPSPIPENVSSESVPNLFSFLLPRHISDLVQSTSANLSQLLSRAEAVSQDATLTARSSLSSVGLPGSIELANANMKAHNTMHCRPAARFCMDEDIATSRYGRLSDSLEELQDVSRRALTTMANIDEALDREERKDREFRTRCPGFTAVNSNHLTTEIRMNNRKMRDAFANAQRSDASIREQLSEDAILPSAPPAPAVDLLDFDEGLSSSSNSSAPSSTTALEDALSALADLIESREKILLDLKTLIGKNHLAQDVGTLVDALVRQCGDEEKKILTVNEVVKKLEQTINKFFNLQTQITSGVTFYTNLQSRLTTLMQSADDLAYTQQWQRQEFELSKEQLTESKDREMALELERSLNLEATSQQQQQYPGMVVGTAVAGPPSLFHSTGPPAPAAAPGPVSAVPEYSTLPPAANNAYPNPYQQQQQQQQQPSPSYPSQPMYSIPQHNPAAQPQGYTTSAPSLSMPPQPNPYHNYPYTPQSAYAAVPSPASGGGNLTPQSAYFFGGVDNPSPATVGAYPATSAAPPGPYLANPNPNPILAPPANFNPPPPPPPAASKLDPTQHPDFARKITSLCEMGFPYDKVKSALIASNGDQDAAANALLSDPSSSSSASAPSAAADAGAKSATASKSFWWGKK